MNMFMATLYSSVVFSYQKCLAYFFAQTKQKNYQRSATINSLQKFAYRNANKKWRKRKINRNFIVKYILQKATTSSYESMEAHRAA